MRSAVSRLNAALRARDLDGTLALFSADAIFSGSEEAEAAAGPELSVFFTRFFELPFLVSWQIGDVVARTEAPYVWFLATATLELEEGGEIECVPYRLSGVLESTADRTLIRMLNGSEPAVVEDGWASGASPPGEG